MQQHGVIPPEFATKDFQLIVGFFGSNLCSESRRAMCHITGQPHAEDEDPERSQGKGFYQLGNVNASWAGLPESCSAKTSFSGPKWHASQDTNFSLFE